MSFRAPDRLFLLCLVLAAAAGYVVVQLRRRHYAVNFTNLKLLKSVAPKRPGWRRHVPAVLMLVSFAGMVVGLSRPVHDVKEPRADATVVLAIDVSSSMDATDVEPSRLKVAQQAALDFVDALPDTMRVGLVSFSASAKVVTPPTQDHDQVQAGIRGLKLANGTAGGDAVELALNLIHDSRSSLGIESAKGTAIVLLSDGVSTVGEPLDTAAQAAADADVPVSTIAFGTPDGTVSVNNSSIPVPADPDAMSKVAEATGGRFFEAASSSELHSVYDDIGSDIGYSHHRREFGMTFVALALALLGVAFVTALIWTSRIL